MRDARSWATGSGEDLVADPFAEAAVILRAVVEVEAVQATKLLLLAELAEVHGEARMVVDLAEAAGGAFQFYADLEPRFLAVDLDRARHVLARLLLELLALRGVEHELEVHEFALGEERARRIAIGGCRGGGLGLSEHERAAQENQGEGLGAQHEGLGPAEGDGKPTGWRSCREGVPCG